MRAAHLRSPASARQFALRFRLLMSYHNLTLHDIALATRSAVSTVGTWKNGRVPSSGPMREKLAEFFRVSVDYLLEGRLTERAAAPSMSEAAAGRILDDLQILLQAIQPAIHGQKSTPPAQPERREKKTKVSRRARG